MREIKFRAWDIKGNQYWGATEGDWKIELHDGHPPQLFIFDYECERGSWIEIEDVVFEEYTGLKDKNGREIFEGDITRYHERNLMKAFGGEVGPDYIIKTRVVSYMVQGFNVPAGFIRDLEVIGNIREDAQLLEVQS